VDRSPNAFPGYSLLTAFGEAAPLNLEYQQANRVLPFPFHFLNNHLAMNIKPKNYDWVDFYDKVIDLTEYTFSPRMLYRRFNGHAQYQCAVDEFYAGRIFRRLWPPAFFPEGAAKPYQRSRLQAVFLMAKHSNCCFLQRYHQKGPGQMVAVASPGRLQHNPNAYLHKTRSKPQPAGTLQALPA